MTASGSDRVRQLLEEYVAARKSGEDPDPVAYLDRLEGIDRAELEVLMDAHLARAPGREFDPQSFAGSPAEEVAEELANSLTGASGLWPALLPRLRERAKIKRADLVKRLAESLGAPAKEEKVARYYHEMEQGLLPADGVTDRVLDALGSIVGETSEALRRAGQAFEPAPMKREGTAWARTTIADADAEAEGQASPARSRAAPEMMAERDEIDELFTGRGA